MLPESHWLNTDFRTIFVLRNDGRMIRTNEPDNSRGRKFYLAGCADGNVGGVGIDVPDDIATKLEALIADEPPWGTGEEIPQRLDQYLSLIKLFFDLGPGFNIQSQLHLIYELPHLLQSEINVQLIDHNSIQGKKLLKSWEVSGLPGNLLELGFKSGPDIWPPWCAAVVDDEVASLAFTARLSDKAAELGLVTVKSFRGRGLAAAAVAGWTTIKELQSRKLFYSTSKENLASQRVAEKLGLRRIGTSLTI